MTGTIAERFARQAQATPSALAVRWHNQALTYAELDTAATATASRLASSIAAGSRIGICLDRTPEAVAAILGTLRASCSYVPLDPAWPQQRLQLMARAADVTAVLAGPSGQDSLGGGPWTFIDPATASGGTATPRRRRARPSDLAYVAFTSGSTGQPKAVGVTHAQLLALYAAWLQVYRLGQIRAHLQMAPISFDVFSGDLARALLSGAALVICPRQTAAAPAALYQLLADERVECAEFTPPTFMPLVGYLQATGRDLRWMKRVIVGSDRWTVADWQVAREAIGPGPELINSYGTTETTIDATWLSGFTGPLPPGEAVVPIGRPLPGVRCRVVGPDLAELPAGEPGELAIGGVGVTGGYLGDPALTAARFRDDPANPGDTLYLTGDQARLGPHGLELLGRLDDEVKIGAARVQPAEVERALAAQPGVSAVAVVPVPGPDGSPRLAGWITPATVSGRALRARIRAILPPHAIPAAVTACAVLPLTPAGKIDRQALAARGLPVTPSAGPDGLPAGPVALEIAEFWREALGVPAVAAHDDFFELGGDSMLAMAMTARIEHRYRIALSPQVMYQTASLRELADRVGLEIAAARPPGSPSPVPRAAASADVIVTGGTGAIGSLIAAELAERGLTVAVTGRPGSEDQASQAAFISADLSDTGLLEAIAARARAIIHAAWDFTSAQPNVTAMEALLRGWRRGPGGPLVFISTTDAARPTMFPGQYATAKAQCQQMLADAVRMSGLPWAVLQPAFVWGPRRRFSSQLLHGDLAWLTRPLTQDAPVTVPGPDRISAARHGDGWIDARDLARAAAAALGQPPQRIITATAGQFSWYGLARTLRRLYGSASPIILGGPGETGHTGPGCGPGQLAALGITPDHLHYGTTLRHTLAAAGPRKETP